MIDTSALWDYEAMKKRQAMLPPWSPEIRDRVRQDLHANPMVEVAFHPYPLPNGEAGRCTRVVDPQPTVLREERKARAANIGHYCRKCRGLGTKRHHAMCLKRGRLGNHGNGVCVVTECSDALAGSPLTRGESVNR